LERVFDDKDIPNEKKVKLIALKPCMYGSVWWANIMAKTAKKMKKLRSVIGIK